MPRKILPLVLVFLAQICLANQILIPMDNTQTNHLKAYGLAYILLKGDIEVDWLLNTGGAVLRFNTANPLKMNAN